MSNNRTRKILAEIVSGIFHPLLMPTYSVMLLFVYTNFGMFFRGQEFRFLLPVLIFTFIIPMAFLAILKELKIVKDYDLSDKHDRIFPFIIGLFANCSLFYFFYSANLQLWFLALLGTSIVLILISLIISLFWKISVHMIAIGGVFGSTLAISYYIYKTNPFILFCALIIFAGGLGVARLYLRKNTPAQVYVGFVVGCTIGFLNILFGPMAIIYISSLIS